MNVRVTHSMTTAVRTAPYHRDEWRCRLAQWVYSLSHVAIRWGDRIDPPTRHDQDAWEYRTQTQETP